MTLRERYAEARLTPGAIRYDQSNWMAVLIELGRRDRQRKAAEPDGPVPVVVCPVGRSAAGIPPTGRTGRPANTERRP